MSVVVAALCPVHGKVHIATDRAITRGDGRQMIGHGKVILAEEGIVIASVGSMIAQTWMALEGEAFLAERSHLILGIDDIRQLSFEMFKWMRANGHVTLEDGVSYHPCPSLAITPHGIFELTADGGVVHIPITQSYHAIGAGSQVALGAIHALKFYNKAHNERFTPKWLTYAAVNAASSLIDSCAAGDVVNYGLDLAEEHCYQCQTPRPSFID